MVTLSTSLRIATVLLTTGLFLPSALAQQATHTPAPVRRTTAATKPRLAAAKPATATRPTAARPAAAAPSSQPATAQSGGTQPKAQPAAQPQPAPVQAAPFRTHAVTRSATSHSQTSVVSRHKYLNVGVGLAAYYGAGLPLGASFEVDVKDNISVGGSFDYLHYSGGYTFIYAGARGSYHLGELLSVQNHKFDPYIGATLGFRHAGYDNAYGYDYGGYNSGLFLGAHLGSRYYFGKKVGGFAEVGYGVSALRIGVTATF